MALDLRMKNGFRAISFEYIGVLDLYFIHRYIIIKYRSSLITDKIHQLLLELWPFVNDNAHSCEFGNSGGIRVPWTHFYFFYKDKVLSLSIDLQVTKILIRVSVCLISQPKHVVVGFFSTADCYTINALDKFIELLLFNS